MPTLIGRFNELLHQLSSSSSTSSQQQQQLQRRQQQQQQHSSTSPTTRQQQQAPSSAVPSRTSVARHQSSGSGGGNVRRHASLSAADRPSPLKSQQQQPLPSHRSSNAGKSGGGGNTSHSRSSSGSRPTATVKSVEEHTVDGGSGGSQHHNGHQHQHRPGQSSSKSHSSKSHHHSQHRPSNHSHQSSSSTSRRDRSSSSRRDSTPSSASQRRSSTTHHQQLAGSSRRRHSIASVTSSSGGTGAVAAGVVSEHRSKQKPATSSSTAMTSRNSNNKKGSSNVTETSSAVQANVEQNNNNNNINVPSKTTVMNRRKGSSNETVAAAATAAATVNGESGEETLASKFVRKMKISGITRKSSSCTPSEGKPTVTSAASASSSATARNGDSSSRTASQITADKVAARKAKHQAKMLSKTGKIMALKSAATTYMTAEEAAKGCFINRYLDGEFVKQHPEIVSGKTCYDLPVKDIETLATEVVASCTGPSGGLTTVNCSPPKPFDLAADLEVDFIDEDYPTDSSLSSTGAGDCLLPPPPSRPLAHKSPKSSGSTASTVSSDVGDEGNGTPPPSSSENTSPVNGGAAFSSLESDHCSPVAGINDWSQEKDFAYGISTSLYESQPVQQQKQYGSAVVSKRNAGDPIADTFAVVVRENSAILALADGVNWGEKSCLASRCAVYGCMDYLNRALYSPAESTRIRNTLDIFVALLRSFNAAHDLILEQGGHLTTLCAAVVCQLKDSDRFIVCTCNVGDSLAYVYSPLYGVREITQESHDIFAMRDMRDALGALGPASGCEPELNNLTVAMTVVDVNDIVFLTSDGISDNFDPVVGKFAFAKKEVVVGENGAVAPEAIPEESTVKARAKENNDSGKVAKVKTKICKAVQRSNSNPERSHNRNNHSRPLLSAKQRHDLTLLRMEDLIMNGLNCISVFSRPKCTAREFCHLMVEFSTKLTTAKRRILEDPELYSDSEEDLLGAEAYARQRQRRRQMGSRLMHMPGKLDHATVAAIDVGFFGAVGARMARGYSRLPVGNSNRSTANGDSAGGQKSHHKSSSRRQHPISRFSMLDEDHDDPRFDLKMKATLARFESQDFLECCCESGPI